MTARPSAAESRAALASWANTGKGPIISADSDRDRLIRWLEWNDANGDYSDTASEAQGLEPLSLADCWALIATAREGSAEA